MTCGASISHVTEDVAGRRATVPYKYMERGSKVFMTIPISSQFALNLPGSDMLRYAPEPRNTAKSLFNGLAKTFSDGLSTVAGTLVGIDPQYAALISEQIKQQEQMQLVSLYSNIEKSRHETQMAAIRNVRVG